MPLGGALHSQPPEHCAPFHELSLHLGLDVKSMVGDSLCFSALVEVSFELQYAPIQGKVVREESAAFALERPDAQGLRRIDSRDISILPQEFLPHCLRSNRGSVCRDAHVSLEAGGHLRVSMLSVDIGTSFSLAISHYCT